MNGRVLEEIHMQRKNFRRREQKYMAQTKLQKHRKKSRCKEKIVDGEELLYRSRETVPAATRVFQKHRKKNPEAKKDI